MQVKPCVCDVGLTRIIKQPVPYDKNSCLMAFLFTDMHILVGNARNKSFICFKKHLPITVYDIIDILSTGLPRKKWLHLKKCLILTKPCYIKLFDTFLKRFFTSRIKKSKFFWGNFPFTASFSTFRWTVWQHLSSSNR